MINADRRCESFHQFYPDCFNAFPNLSPGRRRQSRESLTTKFVLLKPVNSVAPILIREPLRSYFARVDALLISSLLLYPGASLPG